MCGEIYVSFFDCMMYIWGSLGFTTICIEPNSLFLLLSLSILIREIDCEGASWNILSLQKNALLLYLLCWQAQIFVLPNKAPTKLKFIELFISLIGQRSDRLLNVRSDSIHVADSAKAWRKKDREGKGGLKIGDCR